MILQRVYSKLIILGFSELSRFPINKKVTSGDLNHYTLRQQSELSFNQNLRNKIS